MIEVSALGFFYSMKYQIAQMKRQGGGGIVHLASIAGSKTISMNWAYVGSKHAVVRLTRSSALITLPKTEDICVFAVALSPI